MRRRFLRADTRGATLVEFAVILPAVLTLICGAIELGHMMFARIVLEGAVTEAARLASATIESSQSTRETAMRAEITRMMAAFPLAPNQSMTITTRVYRDFSTAYPEPYQDANRNGAYDLGEPYTDRNQNGAWDPATPISGTMGGPGDVVSYTAVYPKRVLFAFLGTQWAMGTAETLKATTVVRNEAVKRNGA